MAALLEVRDLSVEFPREPGPPARVLSRVCFDLARGECLALAGESGSGKTITALSLIGLVPAPGRVVEGSIRLAGSEISTLSETGWRRVRGRRMALVAQEAAAALNPVRTIGSQLREVLRLHRGLDRRTAGDEAQRLLDLVAIPDARRRLDAYAHELSGGQRQRVLLALALAGEPEVLLADEPTASLDGPLQRQVLDLLADLRARLGLTILFITHDLALTARFCDRVAILYGGELLEEGPAGEVLDDPSHPYTQALVARLPGGELLGELPGEAPDPAAPLGGCVFAPRCAEGSPQCELAAPTSREIAPRRAVKCFRRGSAP